MQVPLEWLRDFVDIDVDPARLAADITMSGIKVDAVDKANPGICGVVAAKVLETMAHPSADNLRLARIDAGERGTFTVVCGAPNLEVDTVVPYAPIGSKIPALEVREAVIRGVASPGMLLGEKELGIGDDGSGLMILPRDTKPGADIVKVLALDDTVLILDITPNRGDCLSLYGVAKQVAAIYDRKARIPYIDEYSFGSTCSSTASPTSKTVPTLLGVASGLEISVELADREGCPRYLGGFARDVKIGPSPLPIQNRLRKAGLRPINNVVDVTNYLLIALGHPMHAFDMSKISGKRIIVRSASEGEIVHTLDTTERVLKASDLVIADGKRIVAVAGVMGGMDSEIADTTKDIFLEIALFDPVRVRGTSKRLGLSTESSQRFERGVDEGNMENVMRAALGSFAKLTGAKIDLKFVDAKARPLERARIRLERSYLERYTGNEVTLEEAVRLLVRLGFEATIALDGLDVVVPTHRNDCRQPVDLVEEICALHGYMTFPDTLPSCAYPPRMEESYHFYEEIKDAMKGLGFSEAISFGFGSVEGHEALDGLADGAFLELVNPIGSQFRAMRQSLVPSLVEAEKVNLRQGRKNVRLFEIGHTFHIVSKSQCEARVAVRAGDGFVSERAKLAFIMTETSPAGTWKGLKGTPDFSNVRGVIEALARSFCIKAEFARVDEGHTFLHNGQQADIIIAGKKIGFVGKLHPRKAALVEVEKDTFVAELDLAAFEKYSVGDGARGGDSSTGARAARKQTKFKELAKFPASLFDIALVVEEKYTHGEIEREIVESGGALLEKVEIFDVYRGKGVDEGHKSMAYSLVFRSRERTLRDDEVKGSVDSILASLKTKFGARLREI